MFGALYKDEKKFGVRATGLWASQYDKVVNSDLFIRRFLNTGQSRVNSVLSRIESWAGTDFWLTP
jgi:hypothetical protein